MKKVVVSVVVFLVFVSSIFAGAQLIITSKLDKDNMPTDKLTEIPFDKEHEYLMFAYNDDNTSFGVEKVYYEINIYDKDKDKYVYSDLYTVNTKTDWAYCYKGITFNIPMKLKIKVFTDKGELVTKYIEVIK